MRSAQRRPRGTCAHTACMRAVQQAAAAVARARSTSLASHTACTELGPMGVRGWQRIQQQACQAALASQLTLAHTRAACLTHAGRGAAQHPRLGRQRPRARPERGLPGAGRAAQSGLPLQLWHHVHAGGAAGRPGGRGRRGRLKVGALGSGRGALLQG